MTQSITNFKDHQRAWAGSRELRVSGDQLQSYLLNLWTPLSLPALNAFKNCKASDLNGKMRALQSSSALAVNTFHHWVEGDREPLATALGLDGSISGIQFEFVPQWPLTTIRPHVDVALHTDCGGIVAMDCKLTEWLTTKEGPFGVTYFTKGPLWTKFGLPNCQSLVEDIHYGRRTFRHLAARHLLKHALGLATGFGDKFQLIYLYYDFQEDASDAHRAEIEVFNNLVGDELRFRAITYQEFYERIAKTCGEQAEHQDYLIYMRRRYFS